MPEDTTKEQFTVKNIPAHILVKARKIALDENRSLSDVIRELLEQWVKDQEKEAKLKS